MRTFCIVFTKKELSLLRGLIPTLWRWDGVLEGKRLRPKQRKQMREIGQKLIDYAGR